MAAGAVVRVYDPVAMDECRRRFGDGSALPGSGQIEYARDMYDAALGAHALLLLTEWKQFRMPSWSVLRRVMGRPLIIDGRNIYDRAEVESEGFDYRGIGR